MFLNVVPGGERVVLVVLLALWAALLFGGFAFGWRGKTPERRMPTWTRIGSSLALVVAGGDWYLFTRTSRAGGETLLIALGMALGFVGDLALAAVLPLRQPVVVGMAAFGLGHIAYIFALVRIGNDAGLAAAWPRYSALGVWLFVGLVGWYLMVARGRSLTPLRWAALPYALLLAGTAGVAAGLSLQTGAFLPTALGGALFLASDLILAGQLFGELTFPLIGDVIWLTYGPAQALLVYGTDAAILAVLATR